MEPRDLQSHLDGAECSDVEVGRMWRTVEERLTRPPRRRLWPVLAALCTAAAAVVIVGTRFVSPGPSAPGALIETSGSDQTVVLADGSRVDLAVRSRVRVAEVRPEAVGIVLERGTAELEVTRNPQRRFSVAVGRIVVVVIGTRFRVTVEDSRARAPRSVRVEVLRGKVEVRTPGRPALSLVAGEVWTGVDSSPSSIDDDSALDAHSTPPPAETSRDPGIQPTPAGRPPTASQSESTRVAPRPIAAELPRSVPRVAAVSEQGGARSLFEQADRAWMNGRAVQAARIFNEVVKHHPSDGLAPLAALQLGRIRLDALDDPRGAISALESAGRGMTDPGLREDVDARLVEAWERTGDVAACRRFRDRYLERYPRGRHWEGVTRRCPSSPSAP